ncbi:MAG: hypothetical protein LBK91_07115, partial [Synergistaceae bacterium]|nr:hypothetical protein [Synergistaceae bacterium]
KIEKKFASLVSGSIPRHISGTIDSEVIGGLMGLGFSQGEAARAVSLCRSENENKNWTEEDLMMSALGRLQRR